ncbi:hypothetical protein DPMN_127164 [Dreissena polymorpha]|uniref:Uncharacterized protein n=1 Tax=Dreissena polymorpha TaxID=45954 RepID=A0A9D4JV74_DREPO|nr:hypothetical protein DPMN_127164 [Dreissena polymorpha]
MCNGEKGVAAATPCSAGRWQSGMVRGPAAFLFTLCYVTSVASVGVREPDWITLGFTLATDDNNYHPQQPSHINFGT